MEKLYYIGLDIHKKTIAYCIKLQDGTVFRHGEISADRKSLRQWLSEPPGPWKGAKVAHPEMLKAITAAKKKMTGLIRKGSLISCG